MADTFIVFDDLEAEVYYVVEKYRYLYGSCGYSYIIFIKKTGESFYRLMMVSDGNLFNKMENVRINNGGKFSIKRGFVSLGGSEDVAHLIINPDNLEVTMPD